MTNARGKSIDKTYLSINCAEERGFIHRDYLAHCLRWSHVVKYLQDKARYKSAYVCDLGCGKEAPLLRTLYSSRLLPYHYFGIDFGPIDILNQIPALLKYVDQGRILLHPSTSILEFQPMDYEPDVLVMLEVLEHVEKPMGQEILHHIRSSFMGKETTLFLSTPCYNGVDKAANHVYEWTYNELAAELEDQGYILENVWGTFASIRDYEGMLNQISIDGLPEIFRRMRGYYDVNYLATIFAPLFPAHSRNCLWALRRK